MIFETLNGSAQNGELVLIDGGMCHWHLRRDGQITIREIIVLPDRQRQGVGMSILDQLKTISGATSIFAKCPAHLSSNAWYKRCGFELVGKEQTRTGKDLNLWRLSLL